MKDAYKESAKDFIKGNDKMSNCNISAQQIRGRDKILRRIQAQEIIVQTSDKTKRTILMSKECYIKCANKHTSKDTITDWHSVRKVENEANIISKQFARMFMLGKDDHNKDRWDTAVKVVDSRPPPARFHVKDHKAIKDGEECPECRSICSAIDGPLSRIEYLTSLWLDKIGDKEQKNYLFI